MEEAVLPKESEMVIGCVCEDEDEVVVMWKERAELIVRETGRALEVYIRASGDIICIVQWERKEND